MRDIAIDGKVFEVRGLKGREIKAMKKAGLPISRIGLHIDTDKNGLESLDDIIDAAFESVFCDVIDIVEDLDNKDQLNLWKAIQAETWGSPAEEKNSSTSGDGKQIENE